MFPNNVEFYVREKEAERQTDIEQIRLIKQLNCPSPWLLPGRLRGWLGQKLISLGEKIQGYPAPIQPATEQSIP